MSFEDDMLEEGFSNEQDYLDFLCWKADSRMVDDTEEDQQWEYERNKNEVLFRKNNNERLRQWKQKNKKRAKTWEYIWLRNKNIEKDKHHYADRYYLTDCGEDNRDAPLLFDNYQYYKIPTEGSLWTLWKHSTEVYGQWKESNQDLWNCWKKETDAEGTKDFFFKFIHNSDITESFNLCRDFIINHSIPLRDNDEIRKDAVIRAWKETFVHNKTKEEILFSIWRECHSRDWSNWLLWKENHSEEWNRWEKQNFDQYLLMYRYVDAFWRLVDEKDKGSIAFLNQEGNPVKLLMKKDLERSYIDWLSDGYSSDELEENKDTFLNRNHPLFLEFMEMRYRSLWNESHPKEQHIVIGIDKDFYDYEHNNPLSYFYYHELFDKIFPVKTS